MDASIFHTTLWKPFEQFGWVHPFFTYNAETIVYTWIALVVVMLLALLGRWALNHPTSVPGYIVRSIITSFSSMVEQSLGKIVEPYVYFIGALFCIIFVCNALVLIPGMEEPTQDLNTTIAFALIAFFYAQKETLKAHGIKGYFLEYFKMPLTVFPHGITSFWSLFGGLFRGLANVVVAIILFPLEALGKLATVVSLSLRLFGNIFGSAVITSLFKRAASGSMLMGLASLLGSYSALLAYATIPIIITLVVIISLITSLFFGLFEAFIQAFVFSVLSLTYITLGTQDADH